MLFIAATSKKILNKIKRNILIYNTDVFDKKKIDIGAFTTDLSLQSFNEIYNLTEPNTALELLCNMLITIIDKHAPLRSKRVKNKDIPPWLTKDTTAAMQLRDFYKSNGQSKEYKKTT